MNDDEAKSSAEALAELTELLADTADSRSRPSRSSRILRWVGRSLLRLVGWLGLRTVSVLWASILRGALAIAVVAVVVTTLGIGMALSGAAMVGDLSQGFALGWWIGVLAGVWVYTRQRRRVKGYLGELLVRLTLGVWFASARRYHDVYLPREGGVSQIDHIVICSRGVLVIETKNWAGRIRGSRDDVQWTVEIRKSRRWVGNPVRQNDGHVDAVEIALEDTAPVAPIVSLVALVGWGRLVSRRIPGVTHGLSGLVCGIMEREAVISTREVEDLAKKLEAAMLPRNAATRALHELSWS